MWRKFGCVYTYAFIYVSTKNLHTFFSLIWSCIMYWSLMCFHLIVHYETYYDQQQTTAISTCNFSLLLKKRKYVLWLEGNKKREHIIENERRRVGMLWGINDFSHCITLSRLLGDNKEQQQLHSNIITTITSSTLLDFPFILPLVNTAMHDDGDDLTWWWFWIPADAYAVYRAYYIGIHNLPLLFTFPFSLIIRDPFLFRKNL